MYWLHFYQSPKESPSNKNPHGLHLPKDLMQVTLIIFLTSAMVLMRTISCMMFLRDTELKRETHSELELVSGNFQNHQDPNGLQTSLEDFMLFKRTKLMPTLLLTSTTSGLSMIIMELEKFTNQREKLSSEPFSDLTTDSDLLQVLFQTWTPTLTIFKMSSMLHQTKKNLSTDIH